MSTKTTFKRISLVTVAALGLGVLTSVAPAYAAAKTFSLDTTSVTVVGGGASGTALFKITTTDDSATPANAALAAGETITATIVGVPAGNSGTAKNLATNGVIGTAATPSDLELVSLTMPTSKIGAFVPQTPNGLAAQGLDGSIGSAHVAQSDSATTPIASVYYLGVRNKVTANSGTYASVDQGAYTIRLRLTAIGGFVLQESTITVKFVTSAADSGAGFTIAQTGSLVKGLANAYTTPNNVKVTMTNGTAGGRLYASNGLTVASVVPEAKIITTETGALVSTSVGASEALLIADFGTTAVDGVFTTQAAADKAFQNNVFGVYTTDATALDTISVTTPVSLRIRYGATQTVGALAVNAQATATAANSTTSVTATGMSVLATSATGVAADAAYKVPLANKTVTYKFTAKSGSGVVADYPLIFTVTWSGNWSASDVTPVSGALGKQTIRTDSLGVANVTLTNANPVDGAVATITVTGLAVDSASVGQTITWKKSAANSVSVSPGDYSAALKSTNTLTVTVLDLFLAPVAGVVLKPSFGATTDANYSAAPATITTGATGSVDFTWTDAAAVADGTDTLTFTVVSDVTKASSARTVTYKTTIPVVASFKSYYSLDENASTSSTLVPSTGIYADAAGTRLRIAMTRNSGKAVTLAVTEAVGSATTPTTNDLVFYYIQALTSASAAVAGVPVTVKAPTGGFVLNSVNLITSSTVAVTDANGYISFIGGASQTGAISFTITSGTGSGTVAQWVGNGAGDGRFVTLSGEKTGTANGEQVLFTGKLSDRHGNAVSGVSVTINAGGVSSLGGGSTSATYVTLTDGTFTFNGTSLVSAGGVGTFTATATTAGDYTSIAGYVASVSTNSSLAAGNASATASVTWGAGNSAATDNAQAATDAAAEATDAANAATDAANAAAEAADAATAAAQDASDAVAALSAQVATLIAGLKAQLTALTNLIIKIQKKVKA